MAALKTLILFLGWFEFSAAALGALAFILTCLHERRIRPLVLTLALFIPALAVFAVLLVFQTPVRIPLTLAALFFGIVVLWMMFIPVGRITKMRSVHLPAPVDERDTIFSRFHRLVPGSPEFEEYYTRRPEKLTTDNEIRKLPFMAAPRQQGISSARLTLHLGCLRHRRKNR